MSSAWVTGGASGIGAAVVARLAALGRRVYVADMVAPPGDGPAAGSDVVDVRDRAALERSCARAAADGGLEYAVCCAGVGGIDGITPETVDPVSYQRIVDINLTGVVHSIAAATPHLRERGGGSIVAIASLAGLTPFPDSPFYAMTKTAVVGLIRSLGPALARDGIRISAVCPGFVDTPMIAGFRDDLAAAGFPLLRVEEVAEAVLRAATEGEPGSCWVVQPGREPMPYQFRGVPSALDTDGTTAEVPAGL
jgi:NAD(P)-dependent dehydrogenase (short-subunit alcohol dehydrogenase family)